MHRTRRGILLSPTRAPVRPTTDAPGSRTMTYRTIRLEVDDGVAVVTLDRPEVRNAFGDGMGEELGDAFTRCDLDDDVRVVVLTGTPPAFCAGADMRAGADTFAPREDGGFTRLRSRCRPGGSANWSSPRSTATPSGWASRDPAVRHPHPRRRRQVRHRPGPPRGDGRRLLPLDPPPDRRAVAAAEILLTGRTFDGADMRDLGVCRQVLPNDQVLPAAMALAREVAVHAAPLSVAASKQLLWESWMLSRDEVERHETSDHHRLMAHPDAREGVTAFLEHRPPQWQGSVLASGDSPAASDHRPTSPPASPGPDGLPENSPRTP